MLQAKPCHPGIRGRSRFLGLEPFEFFLLFPGFYLCAVLEQRLFVGIAVTILSGAAIRLCTLGRLPGYTLALFLYLFAPQRRGTLGKDPTPHYPTPGADHGHGV